MDSLILGCVCKTLFTSETPWPGGTWFHMTCSCSAVALCAVSLALELIFWHQRSSTPSPSRSIQLESLRSLQRSSLSDPLYTSANRSYVISHHVELPNLSTAVSRRLFLYSRIGGAAASIEFRLRHAAPMGFWRECGVHEEVHPFDGFFDRIWEMGAREFLIRWWNRGGSGRKMRRRAADYRRPVRRKYWCWIWALLGLFLVAGLLLFVVQHNQNEDRDVKAVQV